MLLISYLDFAGQRCSCYGVRPLYIVQKGRRSIMLRGFFWCLHRHFRLLWSCFECVCVLRFVERVGKSEFFVEI